MGNFRGLEPAQFIGIGKLFEISQSEKLQEKRGGFVKERTARLLAAAGDADDLALEQGGHDAVHGHAAH